ncbi:hypothetical protein ACUOBA_44015, partial [Escherichia coli]
RKRAYCLKIQPATGSFARNLIYSTKPFLVCVFIENTQMPSSLDEKNAGGRTPPALKVTL